MALIQTPPYTLRTLNGVLPGVRTFQIHETAKLQLRANAVNLTAVLGRNGAL